MDELYLRLLKLSVNRLFVLALLVEFLLQVGSSGFSVVGVGFSSFGAEFSSFGAGFSFLPVLTKFFYACPTGLECAQFV